MADSAWAATSTASVPRQTGHSRHTMMVRVTHWVSALAFLALLLSGVEILISHPRFYWGEAGNVNMAPLFKIPIPASRSAVPTGYNYTLPDQNGWSRYLHFQSAWVINLTGLLYVGLGLFNGHFKRNLVPRSSDLAPHALAGHLRLKQVHDAESYNTLQRLTYLIVVFVLFPMIIWTGLAMSPAVASAIPAVVTVWGGQQSARTIHFFVTVLLTVFLLVHIVMVYLAGFRQRMRAMTTGRLDSMEKV